MLAIFLCAYLVLLVMPYIDRGIVQAFIAVLTVAIGTFMANEHDPRRELLEILADGEFLEMVMNGEILEILKWLMNGVLYVVNAVADLNRAALAWVADSITSFVDIYTIESASVILEPLKGTPPVRYITKVVTFFSSALDRIHSVLISQVAAFFGDKYVPLADAVLYAIITVLIVKLMARIINRIKNLIWPAE